MECNVIQVLRKRVVIGQQGSSWTLDVERWTLGDVWFGLQYQEIW